MSIEDPNHNTPQPDDGGRQAGQTPSWSQGNELPRYQAPYAQPTYGQGGYQDYQQSYSMGGGPSVSGPYQFSGMPPADARTWATVTHVAAPALYVLSLGWAGFLAPLVLWLIFKGKDPLVRQAAAGSFNFNFALTLVSIAAWVLGFITFGLLLPLTGLVVLALLIVQILFGVFGAIAASRGEAYKYPFQVPILT